MPQITLDRRDAGRILSALREKHRKIKKSIERRGDDFDPELGANIIASERAHQRLIHHIQEEMSED